MSSLRIGILTGGGDAPGLNSAIRALTRSLRHTCDAEVLGIADGYLGLIEQRLRPLDDDAVERIGAMGGTLLGANNRVSPLAWQGRDWREDIVRYANSIGLDGVIAIGGDGTLAIAAALHESGLPTIGLPKTIDNDIAHIPRSLGFDTAVATVTEALDRLQTTGQSHGRVMLLETMGRNAGWLALEAGLAGAADVILLPELPYDFEQLVQCCAAREAREGYTLICVAEGARAMGADVTARTRDRDAPEPVRLGGIAELLAQQLAPQLRSEVRATTLGHVQRGGMPVASDRVLAALLANAAVELIQAGAWGYVATVGPVDGGRLTLRDVAGQTRRVAPDHPLLLAARRSGVFLGAA